MGRKTTNEKWEFVDSFGTFEWKNPHTLNQLYFPSYYSGIAPKYLMKL